MDIKTNSLPRGHADKRYRTSLGMVIMPDIEDNTSWETIITRGIPHFDEWSKEILQRDTKAYALSYKHTEHDFGILSRQQADELRAVLRQLVGPGKSKATLWVDSMYMLREGLGMKDYSSKWVKYGLVPYQQLPVIRLKSAWDHLHPASGKRSAWLWLEKTLGCNQGVYTTSGVEKKTTRREKIDTGTALAMWLQVESDYGFRPADEKDVREEIEGSHSSEESFQCTGGGACIGYLIGRMAEPCHGRNIRRNDLASSINGTFYKDKLILTTVGRIAERVLLVSEGVGDHGVLSQMNLSRDELTEYTKVLNSRKYPFKNIRWLGLEKFA